MIERTEGADPRKAWPIAKNVIIVTLFFSGAAFFVRWAELAIPIMGTDMKTDPRELFVTLGAALMGPIGGIIIGIAADLAHITPGVSVFSFIAHAVAGAWVGVAYKKLVYERLQVPGMPLPGC